MADERLAAKDRILELEVTADEGDDTLDVTAVTFYRNRMTLNDGDGYVPAFSDDGPAATTEVELGEVVPTPSIVRLVSTFQA